MEATTAGSTPVHPKPSVMLSDPKVNYPLKSKMSSQEWASTLTRVISFEPPPAAEVAPFEAAVSALQSTCGLLVVLGGAVSALQ